MTFTQFLKGVGSFALTLYREEVGGGEGREGGELPGDSLKPDNLSGGGGSRRATSGGCGGDNGDGDEDNYGEGSFEVEDDSGLMEVGGGQQDSDAESDF